VPLCLWERRPWYREGDAVSGRVADSLRGRTVRHRYESEETRPEEAMQTENSSYS